LSFSFFSLKRKERNKEKFKANAMLRRFAIPRLPKCNTLLFFVGRVRDTLVANTYRFWAGVLAQFASAYRCEI